MVFTEFRTRGAGIEKIDVFFSNKQHINFSGDNNLLCAPL
jgi:hypothetical protein